MTLAPSLPDSTVAAQARRVYGDLIVQGMPALSEALLDAARRQVDLPAENALRFSRVETLRALTGRATLWQSEFVQALLSALRAVASAGAAAAPTSVATLTLVDDDIIEREILASRLELAIMDQVPWEFADLRARIGSLESRDELAAGDVLRPQTLARMALQVWCKCNLPVDGWRDLQPDLYRRFADLVEEAYHETNRWLVERGVLPEIDLRPYIRLSLSAQRGGTTASGDATASGVAAPPGRMDRAQMPRGGSTRGAPVADQGMSRARTRVLPLTHGEDAAGVILERLSRLAGTQFSTFDEPQADAPHALTEQLALAIDAAERDIRGGGADPTLFDEPMATAPVRLDAFSHHKRELKSAASTPEERATIEIVALMFQSIFAEDHIPPALRVWIARLQMPVLRVAVTEPDFFATLDHPARRLIDRMGAVVLGFGGGAQELSDALEKEIKRVVQVVEAYPDTGRRVFQTVLTEFEKFIEQYFSNRDEPTRQAVSFAQQVEQRETLAIQYTIELRRMLNEVPVQEGVRQFLFQVWADVLSNTAMRFSLQADETRAVKRAAADLIWSASAKVSREERAEVIRRLPSLLKSLRDGMTAAGMDPARQEQEIRSLNTALAAAFTAKAAVIPHERLSELMEQLETLEELLPDHDDSEIDESLVRDLSGHENADLEVVSGEFDPPSPASLAWARDLQIGSWLMLDHRERTEPVQLAWIGQRKHLWLFVAKSGRAVLVQHQQLAALLQSGRLLPAQEEALTVRATRNALAQLEAEPAQLLS